MREITIRLPFLLPTRNQQDRMHFHEKRQLKDRIIREFLAAGIRRAARRWNMPRSRCGGIPRNAPMLMGSMDRSSKFLT